MKAMVDKILRTYGTRLILCQKGEQTAIRGFFQPSNSQSWLNTDRHFSPLGEIPGGHYLYIGPIKPRALAGDTLLLDGREFLLRRVEPVLYRDQPIYIWALCVEKGGEDPWHNES